MRILHTSDWHLGRSLETWSLVEHQKSFLQWLGQLCRDRSIEAVLVSGDVYDRAVPSVEAIGLLEEALWAVVPACPIILISGNHDSAVRLAFGGGFLERMQVHLRTTVADIGRPVELRGGDGTRVLVYGIPYLEPQVARGPLDCAKSHESVLAAAMGIVRADLAERAATAAAAGEPEPRSIVMSHAFITGGMPSDSERDVTVGGVADAPASVFLGVDYVALGHLHGPQGIPLASTEQARVPQVRYSGSPLAYSFSEESHLKSVTILEIGATGPIGIETVETPVPRAMRTITGDLDDLLADEQLAAHEHDWLRVILTDAIRPERAMDRLRERFPFTITLSWQAHRDGVPIEQVERRVDPNAVSPVEVVTAFVEHVTGIAATDAVRDLADEAVQRVRIAEVHA